jgi:hypothetical protein
MIGTQIFVDDERISALSSNVTDTALRTMWLETAVNCYKAPLPRLPIRTVYNFLVRILETRGKI